MIIRVVPDEPGPQLSDLSPGTVFQFTNRPCGSRATYLFIGVISPSLIYSQLVTASGEACFKTITDSKKHSSVQILGRLRASP